MAKNFNLPVKDKPDSQDICFVTSDSYRDLLQKLKPELIKEGNIVDITGKIIGKHKGIANYTIGQRRGVGISGSDFPLYVIDINKEENEIVLGEQSLLKKTVIELNNVNWLENKISKKNLRCSAKIRSTQKESPGTLTIDEDKGTFVFNDKISSTSPGQACVFYLKDQVLGGGWITITD